MWRVRHHARLLVHVRGSGELRQACLEAHTTLQSVWSMSVWGKWAQAKLRISSDTKVCHCSCPHSDWETKKQPDVRCNKPYGSLLFPQSLHQVFSHIFFMPRKNYSWEELLSDGGNKNQLSSEVVWHSIFTTCSHFNTDMLNSLRNVLHSLNTYCCYPCTTTLWKIIIKSKKLRVVSLSTLESCWCRIHPQKTNSSILVQSRLPTFWLVTWAHKVLSKETDAPLLSIIAKLPPLSFLASHNDSTVWIKMVSLLLI